MISDPDESTSTPPRDESAPPSPTTSPASDGKPEGWFSLGIGSVGAASFFSDSGHEVATSLLPSFFTSVLHGTAAGLGIIEGVSDALMGVAKLVAGPFANGTKEREGLAVSGYLGTAVATGAIALSVTTWQLGALRSLAWIARGARSPSRDSLLADLAPSHAYGRAYGVERAGDNLGAVVGPLLAALFVGWVGIRPAFWFAIIPGSLAAVAILVAAREARRTPHEPRSSFAFNFAALRHRGLARPFIPVIFFEFGNMASTLLILRATQLLFTGGRSFVAATSFAILIYAAHNAFAAVVALAGGRWIDRVGPRLVFATGALLYIVAYGGFAAGSHSWLFLLVAFVLAGSGIGLSETSESVLIARALPASLRGTGFGVLGGVQAAGDVVSSVTVGILYVSISPLAAFVYAASWMTLSLLSSSWLIVADGRSEARTAMS